MIPGPPGFESACVPAKQALHCTAVQCSGATWAPGPCGPAHQRAVDPAHQQTIREKELRFLA